MKLIALDVGTKRIGVAKADSSVRIAIPYSAIEVNGEEFKKIASLARAWAINNFVLGLPRNSRGEETEQSRYVRQFAKELKRTIPEAKICFQDESLTSVEAEKRLKNRKKGYKKGDIDSEAAAIILQDFLEEKTGKSTTRATSAKNNSVKGRKTHHFGVVFAIIVLLLLAAAGSAFFYYKEGLRPVAEVDCEAVDADACDDIIFAVATGSGVDNIATELKRADLIRDTLVFQVYVRLNAGGEHLKAGEYTLNKTMSVAEIVELMLNGGSSHVFSFTVFPGDTIFDIRERLVSIGYDADDVNAALQADYGNRDFSWIFEGRPEESNSLEGYLFGDTYEFYVKDTPEAIIERLLKETASVLEEGNYRDRFAERGFNLYQGITLASVVQREANNAEDMAKVAQIFINRMNNDMNLGSDVTTQYAVKLAEEAGADYDNNADALNIDSPYNTRLAEHRGLPYGPISNPGVGALNAVATPDESMVDVLFFLTGDDGLMYYSTTSEGHEQNIIDHCQELCNAPLH